MFSLQRHCLLAVWACVVMWTDPRTTVTVNAFAPVVTTLMNRRTDLSPQEWTTSQYSPLLPRRKNGILSAADGKKGKKKRRRKKPVPAAVVPDKEPDVPAPLSSSEVVAKDGSRVEEKQMGKQDIGTLNDVAKFEFKPDPAITMGVEDDEEKMMDVADASATNNAINLPDIKQARKQKILEEELAKQELEEEASRVRIKRTDKEAFRQLLERQPFADADASYFEEEEYGTVSALLGEGAAPFLAIPFGPLQVGHFIGALVIVLMAFVEYPGFPLTNLPSPLRNCFQGGLATVYTINAVLAGLAAFKAPERGQPAPLWIVKTFSVGGLAYDQLMQLPTLAEIEKAKAVKGKRALKKKK